jgi:ABC-type multidrug transport system fused ATPase/permease subunit
MYSNKQLIRDVWYYVRPYKKAFWLGTTYRVIADLSWLYIPYGLSLIVNFFADYVPSEPLRPVYTALILTFVATIIRHFGVYLAKRMIYQIAERANLEAESKSMNHLMMLDMSWHELENSGNKFKRIERGALSMNKVLRIWVNNAIEILINFVGIIIIILKFDLGLGIAIGVFLATYYYLSSYYRKRAVAAADLVSAKEEIRGGLLFESINNIRSVKVMSMMDKILEKIGDSTKETFNALKQRIYWFQTGNSVRNFYGSLFRTGAMVFIVFGVINGKYEIGFLVLFLGYFGTILQSMTEFADYSEELAVAKNALLRLQNILETPLAIDDEKGKKKFPKNWQKIELRDLSFSYDSKPVLNKISFTVNRGEKVGIVGLSGAGKSTLFKLLLKEHESYTGDIDFDGVPLKKISKKDYFNYLAVVLQETELFNATLRENITITNSKEEKNENLLKKSIEIAHVKDFMKKLPDGVNSIIGEKGIKLSGGEKQRVGMARAIFKNPQMLLLDEATSHLDIESEEKIQDSLHKFFQSVTAIVIAHRLTTIKEMDKIIVTEEGRIVESGSFAELQDKRGRFFDLWEKQKL